MENAKLDKRVATLEVEVERLKQMMIKNFETPCWQKCLGSFENDPAYDDAMRLGREYRESFRPSDDSASNS